MATWPPDLSDDQFGVLVDDIKDWQISHGSQLKLVNTDDEGTVLSQNIGTTLFPTTFPREVFDQALELQKIYNKIYTRVAADEEWLHEILRDLIATDPLTRALWTVHEEVMRLGPVPDIFLEIFRSDYMLHVESGHPQNSPILKQVEFNTISCAGGVHSNRTSDMHRHLLRKGLYQPTPRDPQDYHPELQYSSPVNRTLESIVNGLQIAHESFRPSCASQMCILMIVQANNFNIADERPIEHALWDLGVPTFRLEWGPNVLKHTRQNEARELIYHPPTRSKPMLVSVVYYRAGFEVKEYSPEINGVNIRLRLETSTAIKCPSIPSHLTTLKKVQQALALPGAVGRFLDIEEVSQISATFTKMYPLDTSYHGKLGRGLAQNPGTAKHHVLKPSLEGGGHNVYGEAIPAFLHALPQELWHTYILQEMITPPVLNNSLMSAQGLYSGSVISELGVFGICLWRRNNAVGQRVCKVEIIHQEKPCWSFKTKSANVDEMSVVKGYGCFDSPALLDMESFCIQAKKSAAEDT